MGPFYEEMGRLHYLGALAYFGALMPLYQADTGRCMRECTRNRPTPTLHTTT